MFFNRWMGNLIHLYNRIRKSVLNVHWKDWCWSWNSNTLATWCEEFTHLTRPWCWERLRARGEGDNRGWDGWMASSNQWTWVWVSSGIWRWTGRPGVLQSMGHKELNTTEPLKWTDTIGYYSVKKGNELSNHKMTYMNIKCIFNAKWRKQMWKDYLLYDFNYMASWKRQNYRHGKKISSNQVCG